MERKIEISKSQSLENKNIGKRLFKITWPIFVESILFMLLGSTDVFMIGRYSDNAVAAVGVVNQVIGMVNLVFGIITAGTTIICSQYIGANKKKEEIIRLVGTSLFINVFLGLVLSILTVVFSTQILTAMHIAPELMDYSKSYLKIVGGFIVVQALAMNFSAIIRSYGFTKISMFATLGMNIINLVLNYTLIYGNLGAPELGVAGAATATVVSKIIGTIFIGYFMFKHVIKGFSLKYFKEFPKKEFKSIVKVGVPAAGEQMSYSMVKIVGTVILTYISVEALTVNTYINNIAMFIFIFSVAIGQGTAILVGQLVGKGDHENAYKLCLDSLKKAFLVSTFMAILVATFGRNIIGFFSDNEGVIALGATVLIVNAFLEPGRTFNIVVINSLRASGDVRFPVYVGIVSMWIIGVGLAYVLSITLGLGIPGMWVALALDEWVRGIIMYFRWKSRRWCEKALV